MFRVSGAPGPGGLFDVAHFLLGDLLLEPLEQLVYRIGLVCTPVTHCPFAGSFVFIDNIVSGLLFKVDAKGFRLFDVFPDVKPGHVLRRQALAFVPLFQFLNGQGLIAAGPSDTGIWCAAAWADGLGIVHHGAAKIAFDLHRYPPFP